MCGSFIRRQIRRNKKIDDKRNWTDEQTKKAFPSVSYTENRFVNVKGDYSPYNGDVVYWTKRNSQLYNNYTARAFEKTRLQVRTLQIILPR